MIELRKSKKNQTSKAEQFGVQNISTDSLMKFYTGLTHCSIIYFNAWGDNINCLIFWKGSKHASVRYRRRNVMRCKLSSKNQLFLTLICLRLALLHRDLAFQFGIAESTVSMIISTWVQLLYKRLSALKLVMIPTRETLQQIIPPCFRPFKNLKVIVDCFEVFTQMTTNFEQQGNLYSNYKHHCTFKVLIGIALNGAIIFVSDAYEGAISDKQIFVQSKLAELLQPGDMVMADRGFIIRDHLFDHGVTLNMPPFLKGRKCLTPQEERSAKHIARIRIHVERAIERVRKFKILQHILPLSQKRLVSQIVFVVSCLVNYQEPLVH